jgi:hypothetical protein
MLTDVALKALKPRDKIYKVADRDGMYVRVMPSGAISFRLDYRLNGRRETVYLGKYGRDGDFPLDHRKRYPPRRAHCACATRSRACLAEGPDHDLTAALESTTHDLAAIRFLTIECFDRRAAGRDQIIRLFQVKGVEVCDRHEATDFGYAMYVSAS